MYCVIDIWCYYNFKMLWAFYWLCNAWQLQLVVRRAINNFNNNNNNNNCSTDTYVWLVWLLADSRCFTYLTSWHCFYISRNISGQKFLWNFWAQIGVCRDAVQRRRMRRSTKCITGRTSVMWRSRCYRSSRQRWHTLTQCWTLRSCRRCACTLTGHNARLAFHCIRS